ncbi:8-amino-7-oxononanoate synthase [Calidifontibacter terrae]
MNSFETHLKKAAAQRDSNSLTRILSADHPQGLIDLAGNDYLGLRGDPRVVEGAAAAASAYGAGAGASRLVTGTWPVHEDLERELASYVGSPAALVFSTGYHVNLSVLTALGDEDALIVSDAHNHASLIDGARLARAAVQVVPHLDLAATEATLRDRTQTRALIVTESVFSVLGDSPDLEALHSLAQTYDAMLVVDEAHGIGVVGSGAGLAGSLAASDRVVITTSLSKSLATQGGAAMCTELVREHLINTARPFIFDTGLAPACAGAALTALRILIEEPERAARVRSASARLAAALGVEAPAGAVLSAPMPGPTEALAAVAAAAERGLRIGCFRPPSTPDGISRLRLTAHATLTDNEINYATTVLSDL